MEFINVVFQYGKVPCCFLSSFTYISGENDEKNKEIKMEGDCIHINAYELTYLRGYKK